MTGKISGIFTYPLKSAQAVSHQSIDLDHFGLKNDRKYVLTDSTGLFLSQRRCPSLAKLELIEMSEESVEIRSDDQSVTCTRTGKNKTITVWRDRVHALDYGTIDDFKFLPKGTQLLRFRTDSPRIADKDYTLGKKIPYAFADGFPLLITSISSLDSINSKISSKGGQALPMDRFRANLVVSGWEPFKELNLDRIQVGENIILQLAKPCSRCLVTTVDQIEGEKKGPEPLLTLKELSKGVVFGMNAYSLNKKDTISVGDCLSTDFH